MGTALGPLNLIRKEGDTRAPVSGHRAILEPGTQTIVHVLSAHQVGRAHARAQLREVVTAMLAELAPGQERIPHWEADEQPPNDVVDRVHWASNKLRVLSAQMEECQPWATPAGQLGLVTSSDAEQAAEAAKAVAIFASLVKAEEAPLRRITKDTKRLQLARRWYGPQARALLDAIACVQTQHEAAEHIVTLLEQVVT